HPHRKPERDQVHAPRLRIERRYQEQHRRDDEKRKVPVHALTSSPSPFSSGSSTPFVSSGPCSLRSRAMPSATSLEPTSSETSRSEPRRRTTPSPGTRH